MTGRSLHDALLRALTDGELRQRLVDGDSSVAPALGSEEAEILKRADPERLRRLARFMARHFYRERIVRLYRYSRSLSLTGGRDPLAVLDSATFGSVLDSAVLGSPATAEAVAQLVETKLRADLSDRPFGAALVSYEGMMFRVEAGPRRWQAPAASEDGRPVRSAQARIIELEWNLTPLITALRAGAPPAEPPREPTRLLVALSSQGRVTAVRCPDTVVRLLDLLDGKRRPGEVADAAGLPETQVSAVLAKLTEIGVVAWQPVR